MPRRKQSELDQPIEKATNYQIEQRVNQIFRLMLKGYGRADVFQYIAESDAKNPETAWNISDRQIDNYIQRANDKFREYADAQRAEMLHKAVLRLEYVYMQCIKVQDYSKAIAALRELNLLLGLHEPQKTNVKHEGMVDGKLEILINRTTVHDTDYD